MPKSDEIYAELLALQKETELISSIQNLIGWDERTKMPEAGSGHRADQSAFLAGLTHNKRVNPRIGELLEQLEAKGYSKGDSIRDVNVREWRRDYDLHTKLSRELVEELSRTSIHAQSAWREARETNDFSKFAPSLEKMIDLKRQEAESYGYDENIYDPLLDQYEPGAKTDEVSAVLNDLREKLVPLSQAIAASERTPDSSILHRHFPAEQQAKLVSVISEGIGYRMSEGRIDETTHPFCTGLGPHDVRVTTRYIEDFLNSALFGVIHETGHAMYEQNILKEHWGTPMGEAVSLGIHESQSRLWENIVGRSLPFWEYWYPTAQKYLPALADVSLEDFHFAINEVRPSYIRVEADEVTYNLHILLRFELEREMLTGQLAAKDLPDAWNARFTEYFGIDAPDNRNGCLQDIHWSSGLIGYFATYSLGNLNASQMYEKAIADIGNQDDNFRKGEFAPLLSWLTKNIHVHGRRYNSAQMTEVVTGKQLSADAMIRYLKEKYSKLYKVEL